MKSKNLIFLLMAVCITPSCDKSFLDKKPNKALLVPTTLADLQSLLDNTSVMNVAPALQSLSADEYSITETTLNSLTNAFEKNSYVWAQEPYEGKSIMDWNGPYEQIFYANVVLEGLEKIDKDSKNEIQYNRTKGNALFYRAIAHYHIAQLFADVYTEEGRESFGIPYRLSADVNTRPGRMTLKYTYDMMINDLNETKLLLPAQSPYKGSPGIPAAHALLARIYLSMGFYDEALLSAESCLNTNNGLIDFNSLTATSSRPISATNEEVLFYTIMINYSFTGRYASSSFINKNLFQSYDFNDLRRTVFFNNRGNDNVLFKGNYTGSASIFAGLATDEVYLIKAECQARKGLTQESLNTLNLLMEKRWDSSVFVPYTAETADEALNLVLLERRKELVTRGLRWTDLKRLNNDPRFASDIVKEVGGIELVLPAKDKRYIFPIPDDEINLNNIEQNPG